MKKRGFKKYIKWISFFVIMLFIGVITATVCAQVVTQDHVQDSFQEEPIDESTEESEENQGSESRACIQLRLRKRNCDCSSNCTPQDCQFQKRNCGC